VGISDPARQVQRRIRHGPSDEAAPGEPRERRPDDAVLTVGLTVFPYERFYKAGWEKVTTLEEMNQARSRGARTWLVYTMPVVLQAAYPEIKAAIDAEFETVKKFSGTLNGGEIVVARAKSPVR